MIEEPQGQGGLDGEIRVAPLPAAPAGRPGSDRFRGQPQCHVSGQELAAKLRRPTARAHDTAGYS